MQPGYSSGWGFISGGTEGHEIELKSPNIASRGVPDPQSVASMLFCHLDQGVWPHQQPQVSVVVVARVQSHGDKHVNTCLYHCWAVTADEFMVVIHCYIDRQRLCKRNGVKVIVLCGLQVEIINIHVFTHYPGLVHHVLHTK